TARFLLPTPRRRSRGGGQSRPRASKPRAPWRRLRSPRRFSMRERPPQRRTRLIFLPLRRSRPFRLNDPRPIGKTTVLFFSTTRGIDTMVRQLPDSETDPVREDAQRFLASRPDLSPASLAQFTRLAESTVRSFIRGLIPGGVEVVSEMRRVLAQARAGDILQPGGNRECRV